MKPFIASLLYLILVIQSSSQIAMASPNESIDKRPPNVLFLLTDDQRRDTIGALGNPTIKTPNLDKISKRGFVFTNAYCMGSTSGAVCNPSRHQIMSGMSLFKYGKTRPDAKLTFGQVFTDAGYVTYHESKKGNTAHRYHKGFTHSSYLKDQQERTSGQHGKAIAENAIEFLENKWDAKKPLFMYLGFSGPHDPRVAAKEWMDLYDREQIKLPKNFMPFHPLDNGEMFVRDEKLAPWPRTEDDTRKQLHDYYGCISSIDHQIGRVLKTLEAKGQLENTILIFSSDHGLAMGSHGLFGKQSVYEHSFGAPLIIAGPGIKHGTSAAFAYLFDIFPTAADLAGLKTAEDLDGKSLVPVMKGEATQVRESVFLAYKDVQRAVRMGDWKLIRYPKINTNQLFNLKHDPDELSDLAFQNREKTAEMMKALEEEQVRWNDPHPLTVENPGKAATSIEFFTERLKKEKANREKKAKQKNETRESNAKESKDPIRVLSYNIHHGAGIDGKLDLRRIAKVIESSKADIVALQEVDHKTTRSDRKDQAAELGKLLKMDSAFGGNIRYKGGEFGNAILTRFPIVRRKNHKLPRFDKGEQRGVLEIVVKTPQGDLRILSTHFDHRKPDGERRASAQFVNQLLKAQPNTPTLVAGDLNTEPDSQTIQILSKQWQRPSKSSPTFPVANPTKQIDYVFAAPESRIRIINEFVLANSVASDHRAILATASLTSGKDGENNSQK